MESSPSGSGLSQPLKPFFLKIESEKKQLSDKKCEHESENVLLPCIDFQAGKFTHAPTNASKHDPECVQGSL